MITGAHVILFGPDAEATRAFLGDVLGLRSVDAGEGWLIFALPPAEIAAHPTDGVPSHELYLMCDDIETTAEELKARGVEFTEEITVHAWGRLTAFRVPGGGALRLYQPTHPSPPRG